MPDLVGRLHGHLNVCAACSEFWDEHRSHAAFRFHLRESEVADDAVTEEDCVGLRVKRVMDNQDKWRRIMGGLS